MPHHYRSIYSNEYDNAILYGKNVSYKKPAFLEKITSMLQKYSITSGIKSDVASSVLFSLLSRSTELTFHSLLHGTSFDFIKTVFSAAAVQEGKTTHRSKKRRDRQSTDEEVKKRASTLLEYFDEKLASYYGEDGGEIASSDHERPFLSNIKTAVSILKDKSRSDIFKLLDLDVSKLLILNMDEKGSKDVFRHVSSSNRELLNKKMAKVIKSQQGVDLVDKSASMTNYLVFSLLLTDHLCADFIKNVNHELAKAGETTFYEIKDISRAVIRTRPSKCLNDRGECEGDSYDTDRYKSITLPIAHTQRQAVSYKKGGKSKIKRGR